MTLGAVVSFALARWLGRDLVQRAIGGHATFCSGCSDAALTGVLGVPLGRWVHPDGYETGRLRAG